MGRNEFSKLEKDLGLKEGTFHESFGKVLEKIDLVYKHLALEVKNEHESCKVVIRIAELMRK